MFISNLFAWVLVLVIVLGIIAYANPQLRENAKGVLLGLLPPTSEECPQINVPINESGFRGLTIRGKTYDGWTVKGYATCRKGTKEGENLNKYYCGGYTSTFGIGSVNAYVEKTIISERGDIGKTYKYVIWNIYDENKNFVETRCIGDPDVFDRKQEEAFYNELLKWR